MGGSSPCVVSVVCLGRGGSHRWHTRGAPGKARLDFAPVVGGRAPETKAEANTVVARPGPRTGHGGGAGQGAPGRCQNVGWPWPQNLGRNPPPHTHTTHTPNECRSGDDEEPRLTPHRPRRRAWSLRAAFCRWARTENLTLNPEPARKWEVKCPDRDMRDPRTNSLDARADAGGGCWVHAWKRTAIGDTHGPPATLTGRRSARSPPFSLSHTHTHTHTHTQWTPSSP